MTTASEEQAAYDLKASLSEKVMQLLDPEVVSAATFPDILNRAVDRELTTLKAGGSTAAAGNGSTSGDDGFTDLIGFGAGAPGKVGDATVAPAVVTYDDKLDAERVGVAADLYYLYLHEAVGAFRVVWKLQELFRAGSLRISSGPGAFALYRFDKHSVLRYKTRERFTAYRRVLGYTNASPGPNARANPEFHGLFTHFITETAKFWRDKRISEVIRDNATDPTFGSMAIVRRAGLDLRNNLKNSSYGWINVLRIETMQALAEAFRILSAEDVRAQFGAETAWDTIELVSWQYFGTAVSASTMNRMAVAGRDIIQWLAQPYVLQPDRKLFEARLYDIAESAEEWISSDEGMRLSRPTPPARNVYQQGPPPAAGRRPVAGPPPVAGRSPAPMRRRPVL